MERSTTRRRFIGGVTATLGATRAVSATTRADRGRAPGSFSPAEHGFGFRNWSSRTQYFDAPPSISRQSVTARIRNEWRRQARAVLDLDPGRFPDGVAEAIATQLRFAVAQHAGTNGHCYGMALTAQRYFERPETIPVDRPVASEIEDPTVPVEEPDAPVYETIVRTQAEQFLRFRAWLGRKAMVHPGWIDIPAVLHDVRSVVETTGTATLSLFDGALYAHQVLAYDYTDHGDGVTVPIYDPNRTARTYRRSRPTLRFERDGDGLTMEPYGRYTGVLFNRFDQIERVTGRTRASPLDHLTVDRPTLRASLFPFALVLVDSEDVALAVNTPDGGTIDRLRGTYMDRTAGEYGRVRSLYGAPDGTYEVSVLATSPTDYELSAVVVDSEGTLLDASRSASVETDSVDTYELELFESGDVTMGRPDRDWLGPAVLGGAGTVGGAAGYWALRRYSTGAGNG